MDHHEFQAPVDIFLMNQNLGDKLTNPEYFHHHKMICTKPPQLFQAPYNQKDLSSDWLIFS